MRGLRLVLLLCAVAPSISENVCGNGVLDRDESCDDGNRVAGDGCTLCIVDTNFACTGTPSVCVCIPGYFRYSGGCRFCVANSTCSGKGTCWLDGSCYCSFPNTLDSCNLAEMPHYTTSVTLTDPKDDVIFLMGKEQKSRLLLPPKTLAFTGQIQLTATSFPSASLPPYQQPELSIASDILHISATPSLNAMTIISPVALVHNFYQSFRVSPETCVRLYTFVRESRQWVLMPEGSVASSTLQAHATFTGWGSGLFAVFNSTAGFESAVFIPPAAVAKSLDPLAIFFIFLSVLMCLGFMGFCFVCFRRKLRRQIFRMKQKIMARKIPAVAEIISEVRHERRTEKFDTIDIFENFAREISTHPPLPSPSPSPRSGHFAALRQAPVMNGRSKFEFENSAVVTPEKSVISRGDTLASHTPAPSIFMTPMEPFPSGNSTVSRASELSRGGRRIAGGSPTDFKANLDEMMNSSYGGAPTPRPNLVSKSIGRSKQENRETFLSGLLSKMKSTSPSAPPQPPQKIVPKIVSLPTPRFAWQEGSLPGGQVPDEIIVEASYGYEENLDYDVTGN